MPPTTTPAPGEARSHAGSHGYGLVLFAAILLFVVPLVPGIRDIPGYLKLYRFIYRYPRKGDLDKPELVERHGATHGG